MLRAQDLTVNIGKQKIVEQLHLEFQPGEIWGIFGPNGVGKTTFLHTLAGLRTADGGKVLLSEMDIKEINPKQRAQKIGLLAQDTEFSFPSTVFETALIGRYPYSKKWFSEMHDDFELTKKSLTAMQLDNFADRLVTTLSGGERRRLALATVLTQDPDFYLLDEPTNHLDLAQKIRALSLLKQLAATRHKTIIMVLHDIHLLRNFCDKVMVMQFGGQCDYGDCAQMLSFERLGQIFPVEVLRLLLS